MQQLLQRQQQQGGLPVPAKPKPRQLSPPPPPPPQQQQDPAGGTRASLAPSAGSGAEDDFDALFEQELQRQRQQRQGAGGAGARPSQPSPPSPPTLGRRPPRVMAMSVQPHLEQGTRREQCRDVSMARSLPPPQQQQGRHVRRSPSRVGRSAGASGGSGNKEEKESSAGFSYARGHRAGGPGSRRSRSNSDGIKGRNSPAPAPSSQSARKGGKRRRANLRARAGRGRRQGGAALASREAGSPRSDQGKEGAMQGAADALASHTGPPAPMRPHLFPPSALRSPSPSPSPTLGGLGGGAAGVSGQEQAVADAIKHAGDAKRFAQRTWPRAVHASENSEDTSCRTWCMELEAERQPAHSNGSSSSSNAGRVVEARGLVMTRRASRQGSCRTLWGWGCRDCPGWTKGERSVVTPSEDSRKTLRPHCCASSNTESFGLHTLWGIQGTRVMHSLRGLLTLDAHAKLLTYLHNTHTHTHNTH